MSPTPHPLAALRVSCVWWVVPFCPVLQGHGPSLGPHLRLRHSLAPHFLFLGFSPHQASFLLVRVQLYTDTEPVPSIYQISVSQIHCAR